jgi:bifunctional ADP-heptose synthase (sugar kinase/adenylyltransferase)
MKRLSPVVVDVGMLAAETKRLRASGATVVHVRGTFDLLRRDEIARLRETANRSTLVVTIADELPGHARSVLGPKLRAEVVAELPFVHGVALEGRASAAETIALVGADEVIEWSGGAPDPVSTQALRVQGPIASADAAFSSEARAFLETFRLRYSANDVIDALGRLKKLKVLVVGDTIIDEYHFVRPYGMPLKAPIIAAQFLDGEAYAGGILAVANHLAGFCGEVHLVTALGANGSREEFIRGQLRPNVTPTFFYRPEAPTTVKRRYVIRFLVQKLFEVGFFDDRPLPPEVDRALAAHLEAVCGEYDLVVVADFGHGCLSEASIAALRRARFLAVNTQLNSINYGYHVVTKYRNVDYICIDENELRMACRDRVSTVERIVPGLAAEVDAKVITVTRGHHGSLTYDRDGRVVSVPILSPQVVDTIGAGDAYLSISAPCVQQRLPADMVGFIGNAVGGVAVRILGNKTPVGPDAVVDLIRTVMEA